MTGIITNEVSFYSRTTLYPAKASALFELFDTPSRWLGADWTEAHHVASPGFQPHRQHEALRCVWRDGVTTVQFELSAQPRGTYRLDVSLDPPTVQRDVGAIANACSVAQQRLVAELYRGDA